MPLFTSRAKEGGEPVEIWVADRHLYLTEDRSRVVEEGDPDGRWLWASPGQEVKRRDAEQLGALKTDQPEPEKDEPDPQPEPEPDPEPESAAKARPASANKARRKPADK